MSSHRSTRLSLVLAIAISGGTALGAQTIPANKVPPKSIPQAGEDASRVEATLKAIRLPPGFRIDLFARVPDARDMAVSDDGRKIFVGTNGDQAYVVEVATSGRATASVKTFAPSIAKIMPHGVCLGPDKTLYLAELNRILAFPDAAARSDSPDLEAKVLVPQGKLIPPRFEANNHSSRACRVGPDGALYVTIGQPTNVPSHDQWQAFSSHGLGAIVKISPDGAERIVYAGGIRNSVGLDFDSKGRLWFTDNQVDMMGDDTPPGEINRADAIGHTFGFPWYGGGHVRTEEWKASKPPRDSIFPQVEMQAHAADLGMIFYRGTAFPERYRGGIFLAQHGSWNRSKPVGAQVMFTPVSSDGKAGAPEVFASGWLTADGSYRGRPVDVAELKDGSLLVSDDEAGAIYRISVAR